MTAEKRRAKLLSTRFGVGSNGICAQFMVTLFVWEEVNATY